MKGGLTEDLLRAREPLRVSLRGTLLDSCLLNPGAELALRRAAAPRKKAAHTDPRGSLDWGRLAGPVCVDGLGLGFSWPGGHLFPL